MQRPLGPPDLKCPFYKKPMSEVCHTCALWVCAKGKNPENGEDLHEWRCSFAWLPVFAHVAAQQSMQAAASCDKMATETEKFRESMERANAISLALASADKAMINGTSDGLLVSADKSI